MGTDIHFYVQKRDPDTKDWVFVEPPESILDDWDRKWEADHGAEPWYRRKWYSGRNYDLFAMLADVRNGTGFAGCDTGDGFDPIAKPRGLPDDFFTTAQMREHDDPEWGHSHTWLTLKEVLEYPVKELQTNHRGWVDEASFKEWLEGNQNEPSTWCGAVSGRNIVHISVKDMTEIVKGIRPRDQYAEYYCQLEWGTTYFESAPFFFEKILNGIAKETDGVDPSDVRLVFWFDS